MRGRMALQPRLLIRPSRRQFSLRHASEQILVRENNCFVAYYQDFLPGWRKLFSLLRDQVPWQRETDDFGPQQRLSYYMGDPDCTFRYVGLSLEPNPWLREMENVRGVAERLVARVLKREGLFGHQGRLQEEDNPRILTGCLLNNYEEGGSFIPWHFDEVRAHGDSKVVMSLSLGGPRRFDLRRRRQSLHSDREIRSDNAVDPHDDKKEEEDISLLLQPGSVLLMAGNTQEHWLHQLPDITGEPKPHRISLTFRSIVPGYEHNRKHQHHRQIGKGAEKMDSCTSSVDN